MKRAKLFRVTLVGRPNTGKSSLFNALLGFRRSIVLDEMGTTRDAIVEEVNWGEGAFQLVDCFGAAEIPDIRELESRLAQTDAVLFVVDSKVGLVPGDRELALLVHQRQIPTLVCVNKSDTKASEGAAVFGELPLEHFAETSASHRRGLSEVRGWVAEERKKFLVAQGGVNAVAPARRTVRLALLGRPNAGKSTLMNRLCGERISAVSPIPHTTRDPVRHRLDTAEGVIELIDTAGMRRPRSEKSQVEIFSIQAATRALAEANVVFVLVDASDQLTDQDLRLLNLVEREGKPAAVLLNFWDRMRGPTRKEFWEDNSLIRHLKRFPTQVISGKTGFNVEKLLPLAWELADKAEGRIPTSRLNHLVESIIARNPPPSMGRGNFNVLYASQVRTQPPTFAFFCNRKQSLPLSYQRYLTESLRKELELSGQALRIVFREARGRENQRSKNPANRHHRRPRVGKNHHPRTAHSGAAG